MTHIFTYGSLMFEQIWNAVVSTTCERMSGTLYGYERRNIRGETYPAIIPGSLSSTVSGVLYLNIEIDDIERLDAFEGTFYNRKTVHIHTDNNIFAADAYILSPSYRHIVTSEPWDPAQFSTDGIKSFLSTYFGFERRRVVIRCTARCAPSHSIRSSTLMLS